VRSFAPARCRAETRHRAANAKAALCVRASDCQGSMRSASSENHKEMQTRSSGLGGPAAAAPLNRRVKSCILIEETLGCCAGGPLQGNA